MDINYKIYITLMQELEKAEQEKRDFISAKYIKLTFLIPSLKTNERSEISDDENINDIKALILNKMDNKISLIKKNINNSKITY